MDTCARCGHVLGVGRSCPGCGRPVGPPAPEDDWRTGTAERPAVRPAPPVSPPTAPPPTAPPTAPPTSPPTSPPSRGPVTPPPAAGVPPQGARYPLFADEVDGGRTAPEVPTYAPVGVPTGAPTGVPTGAPTGGSHAAPGRRHQPRPWVPWVAGFAALLLVAAFGTWLLLSGNDDEPTAAAATSAPAPSRSRSATEGTSPSPSEPGSPTSGTSKPGKPGTPEDVARLATARVPATAPPNQDTSGNLVRYEARNMLDGVASTCWRMPGDGSGKVVSLDLDEPTTISEVGLVNGYAKTATDARGKPLDWYHGNRRVLTVEWVFDDGTTLRQTLADTRDLQTVRVDDVTTRTVQLRLVSVSAPGTGRAARNYTAISDVALVGTTG